MKAAELLRAHVNKIPPDTTIREMVDLLDLYQVLVLPVVDEDDCLLGAVYEDQVVAVAFGSEVAGLRNSTFRQAAVQRARDVRAADIMRTPAVSADEQDDAVDVLVRMTEAGLARLPVTSGGRVTGTISRVDICQALLEAELLNSTLKFIRLPAIGCRGPREEEIPSMNMQKHALRSLVALLAVAVLPVWGAGCKPPEKNGSTSGSGDSNQTSSGDTIKIGEYGSITGPEAAFGKATDQGIRLAVDEVNAAGGVNGKKLEIIGPEDTASIQQQGEIAVKRLVEKGVVAVLGEVASGISMAGGPVCQSNEIPMISPSSTNPKVTEIGDYVFRVCFIDPYQAGVLAKFSVDTLKAKTAAIMFDAGAPYSVGIHDEFKASFEKRGGRIVSEVGFSKDDKDFQSQLTKIKSANPDVIIVGSYYQQGGTIVKQARDLGINAPILGGDGWDNSEFHTYAGNRVGNAYLSTHASMDDPNPTIQNFVKAFEAKYSSKPDALAALAYDSVMVLVESIKRAKSLNGPDLRDAIAATKDFDGVTGKVTINAQRNAEKGAVMLEVANGTFKFKESIAKEALAGP